MKYIIGLGNFEEKYKHTRHNVGFLVLDYILSVKEFSLWEKDSFLNALISHGQINSEEFTLIKPLTYVNGTGLVVEKLLKKNVKEEDLIFIYDDIAYPFGFVRMILEKGSGGHNGIKSIMNVLKTHNLRIRVGIHSFIKGEESLINLKGVDRASFVLKNFRDDEIENIPKISEYIISVLISLKENGIPKTMTNVNAKKSIL
jgi:PTH1 family peptidyl-tRNA hydrolase